METSEITIDTGLVSTAMKNAGCQPKLVRAIFSALRTAARQAVDRDDFNNSVRWPIITSLLNGNSIEITLSSGLIFEIEINSRIEKALLLSDEEHPDHIWEPQTTKLLTALARGKNVFVGGAYIGDQVLPVSRTANRVYAFEPMPTAYRQLRRNLELNGITNVSCYQKGLWDRSGKNLSVVGDLALASSIESEQGSITSVAIDDYVHEYQTGPIGLIMLDTEGGEEKALIGATENILASRPNIVFEIHRDFVDWSDGLRATSICRFLERAGYTLFAIRDYHGNVAMDGRPIEIIPADRVYLEGPHHGFNMLAISHDSIVSDLGLRVVYDISPKLIPGRDPRLHAPLSS